MQLFTVVISYTIIITIALYTLCNSEQHESILTSVQSVGMHAVIPVITLIKYSSITMFSIIEIAGIEHIDIVLSSHS